MASNFLINTKIRKLELEFGCSLYTMLPYVACVPLLGHWPSSFVSD